MNWLWISGWGIPPEWFEGLAVSRFSHIRHRVVAPDPDGEWRNERARSDRAIGYSLGAFLLCREEARAPSGRPVALLAPFLGFPSEARGGGRIPLTRLRYLRRWMNRDPAAALRDFYKRAGLAELAKRSDLPYERTALEKGLDVLIDDTVTPPGSDGVTAIAGENDPLLDTARLRVLCSNLNVVPKCGHHPAPLLDALAGLWKT